MDITAGISFGAYAQILVEVARSITGAAVRFPALVPALVSVSVLYSSNREDATGGHLSAGARVEVCRMHDLDSQEQPHWRSGAAHSRWGAVAVSVRSSSAVGVVIIARALCSTPSSVASVSKVVACLASISSAAWRTAGRVALFAVSVVCPHLSVSCTVHTVARVVLVIEPRTDGAAAHCVVIAPIIGTCTSIAVSAVFGSMYGPVVIVADVAVADPVQQLRARAIIESIAPVHEQAPWWGLHSATLEVCLCTSVDGIGATSGPTGAATGAWEWVILLLRSHM
jgi:hypothetical protein